MLITELRPQKDHLTGLYADDELIMSIDRELAAEIGLQPMRDYPVDDLRELLEQSELRRAKSKALYLLEFRDYSSRDLEARLRKDFDETSAREAVTYMTEIGAVDNARYAENMIRHLINQKHYGRRRILQELSLKGIDRNTAEEALDTFETDEQAAILALLEGKFSRDLDNQKGIQRTIASLIRYGYEMGDIKDALREYTDRLEEENYE